jgi:hypothetical protein
MMLVNVVCKFHIKTGHFMISHCNLLLLRKYLVDIFYYYHQPKEVRLEVFTMAIVNLLKPNSYVMQQPV